MTFYFYDLETSGVNARHDRIMQFAGQRTDLNLKPVGNPDNFLIKLSPDILPQPDAVLVHNTTPQKTLSEGISEADAAKHLIKNVFLPDSIIVGFNNIRFDDEFIRHLFWRNFTDAYEWQWKEHRSRWDLLDLVRMTRALRPEGLKWPFDSEGNPSNRLELLTAINRLEHTDAHDALSDVAATISVARLVRNKQPKLFDYLLAMRDKAKVAAFVEDGKPFLYTSGRYPSEFEKTTVVASIAKHPNRGASLVFDLRANLTDYLNLSPKELAELWTRRGPEAPYFPVKKLSYNRCPTVAPLSVLNKNTEQRLKIDQKVIKTNFNKLKKSSNFGVKMLEALELLDKQHQQGLIVDELAVDGLLYDGFINNPDDKTKMRVVRAADGQEMEKLHLKFNDERLNYLLGLYKARNFPGSLSKDEINYWNSYRQRKFNTGDYAEKYFARLKELADQKGMTTSQKNTLNDLEAYGQSVITAG